MKISNSKKQLAKIISENGGWPDKAEYSAQDGSDGQVSFYKSGVPIYNKLAKIWNAPGSCVHMYGSRIEVLGRVGVIKNFHQTILSRDEYFHLYPAPDADGWNNLGSSVARDVVAVDGRINTGTFGDGRPTIEQLAAEYRNIKDFAERKQQEADAAKADSDAKLADLVAAGKAIELVLSVAEPKPNPEPELVITWRDLRVGDEVKAVIPNGGLVESGSKGVVTSIGDSIFYSDFPEQRGYAYTKYHLEDGAVKFIRRP